MMKKVFTLACVVCLSVSGVCGQEADTSKIWNLQECLRYAVENSPKAVRQQLANANLKADYHEAILQHLPSISASTRINAGFGRTLTEDNTYANISKFNNESGLSGGITLFNGLSLINNTRISKVSKLRGDELQKQTEDNISIETMGAFYNLSYSMGALRMSREQVGASRENLRQGRRMMALGLKGAADVAQLEATLAGDEYNLTKAENDLRTRELDLKRLMNYPPAERLMIDTMDRYALPVPDTTDLSELVEFAQATLPDARMSVMNVRIAKLRLSTAKASLFPSLSANGGLSSAYYANLGKKREGDVTKAFGDQYRDNLSKSVGASLSIPIFGGWSRQSNIVRRRNDWRSQEQTHIETQRLIAVEVEQALLDLNGAFSERMQAEKQVAARLLAYRVAQFKFKEGLFSALDLQSTSNQLLVARATLLNAELTWQVKRKLVDYYKGIPLLTR